MADPVSAAVTAIVTAAKYIGAAYGASAAGTATAAQVATVVATNLALSVTSAALLSPQVGAREGSPSEWRVDPDAGVPFVVGEWGRAGDIVYRKEFGADNRYQGIVSVYTANGPVEEWGSFTAEDVTLSFGANGVATNGGNMANNFWLSRRDGFVDDTALTSPPGLDGGASLPGWGSSERLPGLSSSMITLRQDSKLATYPNGEPSPFQIFKAPKRSYDPRLDDTYPGGAGPHRRNDRSSWSYSDNGAIHALNFALGYWTGEDGFGDGRLIGGFGNDWSNVDVESYVEAANVADANGWKIGGFFRSTDAKAEIHAAMLQAAGAIYANPAGRTGCISRGAPKTSVLTITAADLAGDVEIAADMPFRDKINAVIPRCPLKSFKFEMTALEAVVEDSYVTADRGRRERRIDFPMVPAVKQCGELAAFAIVNSRERVSGRLPCKPWMRVLKPGDAFTIDEPQIDLVDFKAVVLTREWDPESQVCTISFQSETDSKYSYALGQDPTPPEPDGLTPGSPYTVPAPDGSEWTATGGVIGLPGEATQPGIDLIGGDEPAAITGVWIEYAPDDDGEPGQWTTWYKGEPGETDYKITGLRAGAEYHLRIRYRNPFGVWTPVDDALVLGPYEVGDMVASDALAIGGLTLAELLDDVEGIAAEATVDLAEAVDDVDQRADAIAADVAAQRRNTQAELRSLLARLSNIRSGLVSEVEVRETAVAIEAQRIDGVQARTSDLEDGQDDLEDGQADVEAAVLALDSAKADLAELTALADDLDVLISRVTAVEDEFDPGGRVDEAEATITQQGSTLASLGDDLQAAADLLDQLDAQINDGSSSLSASITDALSAITDLEGDVGSLATATQALNARADDLEDRADDLDGEFEPGGRVTVAEAELIAQQQAAASFERAVVSELRRLTARMAGARGQVLAETLTRVEELSVIAQQVLSLEAELDGEPGETPGLSALVQILSQALVDASDPDNPQARALWALRLNANGTVGGITALADQDEINLIFETDNFLIRTSGGDETPFAVFGDQIVFGGDLLALSAMRFGNRRIPVALQSFQVSGADGDAVDFGADLVNIPDLEFDTRNLSPLGSGEQYDIKAQSLDSEGLVVYAKKKTPGSNSTVNNDTNASYGSGPQRQIEKASSDDASDGSYRFNVSVTQFAGGEPNNPEASGVLEFFFNDGGGWESAGTRSYYRNFLGEEPGDKTFSVVQSMNRGDAIGQHSGREFGVSVVSGDGTINSATVQYDVQSSSNVVTASPDGEKVIIRVLPQNS